MLNRLILLAIAPLVLLAIAAGTVAYNYAQIERDHEAWLVHTYKVKEATTLLLVDTLNAQTGVRGYVLSHNPRSLEPYVQARAALRRDLRNFQILTADNPVQQKRVGELQEMTRRRLDALEHAISTLSATSSPVAINAFMSRSAAETDAIQNVIAASLADENRLLAQREQDTQDSESRMATYGLAAVILAAIFAVIAGIALFYGYGRLGISIRRQSESEERLRLLISGVRDYAILMLDADGRVASWNPGAERIYGYSADEVIGQHFSRFFTPEDIAEKKYDRELEAAVENGSTEVEGWRVNKDGSLFYVNALITALRSPDGALRGFAKVTRDITERVKREKELELSRAALFQSQKMEAIGQLTGGVAHDFNNLLQIVGANLDLVAQTMKGDARNAQRLQSAIGAVGRGSRLTAQLLAFARRQTLEPRSIDLGVLLRGMTDLMRRTLGERVEVETIMAGGLWNTLADPNQLENAIINLAINARDAMPEGGKLTLEVANAYLDDNYALAQEGVTSGQYVMLAVSDTGSGMPPEVMKQAFEPFYTTKPEGHGTGLGLSQIYGFVKQSGGHIKLYSEPGQGTTVKIYLPRTKLPAEESFAAAVSPVEGGTETVLVVEDDDGVRSAVSDMLSELGYTVLRARDAGQALTILSSGAYVHLLFTDVVMPGPIGTRELARRAQVLQPHIAVLYTSGYTQNAVVHEGRLDEGVYLLSKPYRKDELARKLRSLLNKGRPAPAQPESKSATETQVPGVNGRSKPAANPRILVVEDVALVRMSTVDMLEQLGFSVVEAGDGAQALTALENDPSIAIMVADLGLPDMSGRELIEKARALRPALQIVVASGYSRETSLKDPVFTGARYLPKPFDIDQLKQVVES